MASLKLESITDQVRGILLREIEAGKLTPGTRIHETALAQKLGISKSPLRFALYQLKQDGIIRIEPRKGIYVATPTNGELVELVEMREVLEGLAARRAAVRANDKMVRGLEACFAGFKEGSINKRLTEYAAANQQFHRRLIEASKSVELIKTLEVIKVRLHLNWLRARLPHNPDLVGVHREHLSIIEAIRANDADQAESLVAAHVASVPWATAIATDTVAAEQSAAFASSAV